MKPEEIHLHSRVGSLTELGASLTDRGLRVTPEEIHLHCLVVSLTDLGASLTRRGDCLTCLVESLTERVLSLTFLGIHLHCLVRSLTDLGGSLTRRGDCLTCLVGSLTERVLSLTVLGIHLHCLVGSLTDLGGSLTHRGDCLTCLVGSLTERVLSLTVLGIHLHCLVRSLTDLGGSLTHRGDCLTCLVESLTERVLSLTRPWHSSAPPRCVTDRPWRASDRPCFQSDTSWRESDTSRAVFDRLRPSIATPEFEHDDGEAAIDRLDPPANNVWSSLRPRWRVPDIPWGARSSPCSSVQPDEALSWRHRDRPSHLRCSRLHVVRLSSLRVPVQVAPKSVDPTVETADDTLCLDALVVDGRTLTLTSRRIAGVVTTICTALEERWPDPAGAACVSRSLIRVTRELICEPRGADSRDAGD